MTAASPVLVHPHLGVRAAYRLQRLLRPNAGYRWLATRIEGQGPARAMFTVTEQLTKETAFGCRMCGQCALPVTGYVCPMGCPKELRRWGQSSWLNYWQGRDEELWTGDKTGDKEARP
jgi:hypothetical protein